MIRVDDMGNAVAFNTITVEPTDCPSGFLGGVWRNVPDRPGGVFRGRWISHNGVHHGYLRGRYGHTENDRPVFFGKMISQGGRFEALMRGTYGNFENDHPGGWFRGEFIDRNLRIKGGLAVSGRRATASTAADSLKACGRKPADLPCRHNSTTHTNRPRGD